MSQTDQILPTFKISRSLCWAHLFHIVSTIACNAFLLLSKATLHLYCIYTHSIQMHLSECKRYQNVHLRIRYDSQSSSSYDFCNKERMKENTLLLIWLKTETEMLLNMLSCVVLFICILQHSEQSKMLIWCVVGTFGKVLLYILCECDAIKADLVRFFRCLIELVCIIPTTTMIS